MSEGRFEIALPIGEMIVHLSQGKRLCSMFGVSIEHIAPFGQYLSPRLTPQQATEIESTFLLRTESVGTSPDGRGVRRVFFSTHDAIWAFLRATGGNDIISVVDVPTNETDALTMEAVKEGLLQHFQMQKAQ